MRQKWKAKQAPATPDRIRSRAKPASGADSADCADAEIDGFPRFSLVEALAFGVC